MVSIQVLNIVDILSMTKVIDKRKLCLISFLQYHWNIYACLINTPKLLENQAHVT